MSIEARASSLGLGLLGLGCGLAVASLLGPLGLGVIRYRFSASLTAQGVGLDAASLALVAPLALFAGWLALRGHPAAPVLGLTPGAYVAYMSVQYAIGPEYLSIPGNSERFVPLYLVLFVLGGWVLSRGWREGERAAASVLSTDRRRRWGAIALLLGGLLLLRYLPILAALVAGEPDLAEYRENPTSFLLIAWLDLGVVLPITIATGIGLRRGSDRATLALFGVTGWFATTAVAVAAMSAVMLTRGIPTASGAMTAVFWGAAAILTGLAVRLHLRLLRTTSA